MVGRILAVVLLVAAVAATHWPALGFGFLNWDDQFVIVDNAALAQPGVLRWAFTSTYMEHYQPVSWLAWSGLRGPGAPDPRLYHVANLVLHVLTVLLVWAVSREILATVEKRGQSPIASGDMSQGLSPLTIVGEATALAAALLYGVHPLRVEVVAWVSAMPYALASALALCAVWLWLRDAERRPHVSWLSALAFALSLAARPLALGVPVVLLVLDRWLFGRTWPASAKRAAPFFVLGALAAGAELAARAPGLADVPWSYRLQSALSAPFVYMWHTLAPVALTPLDVLPLTPSGDPGVIGGALTGLLLVTSLAFTYRDRWPAVLAGWTSYLALLAPAVGLVPSGLQATADRYTYLPGIVLSMAVAAAGMRWAATAITRRRVAMAGALMAVTAHAVLSRETLRHWSDSVALWARVVELNPANDVGQYNLGVALAAAGQPEAAAERYRAALAANPAHQEARQNLDRLDAARLEHEANELAARGRLVEAAMRYQEALARDPRRPHAHAARGMALATLGRSGDALPHLREAVGLGVDDVAVSNTLAGLLVEIGNAREARAVLEAALKGHPDDLGLAHNLARLLVSLPGLPPPDRMRAFRLAEAVAQATGGQDARALDTLAASLAALGRLADAREFNQRAAAVAAAQGERELAVQITARGRAYR
jgi:tetratricopeptide (TPR) repeat protein